MIALPVIKMGGLRKRATGLARGAFSESRASFCHSTLVVETLRVTSGVSGPMLN